MPYITREDGERFIIPSYRDILSAKKPALLKKEVMLLSANYGEYITLQKKNIDQYEAAFSPDPGYLLGETVWNYFKRPRDLIYCEAIPNTTEAILVIVKGGSVYLDGSFPIDSIPDELVIFRTQQNNNFEIYIYGDIPISQKPEEGKFALDSSSIKSFAILPEPIFPTLPTLKIFQLRLVDVVLRAQGIGVFPTKQIMTGLAILAFVWIVIMYLSQTHKEIPKVFVNVVNPYQAYINEMTTPAPTSQVEAVTAQIARLYTIPGWTPTHVNYASGAMNANVKSSGTKVNVLYSWAGMNRADLKIVPEGIYITLPIMVSDRPQTTNISPLQQVIAEVLDRISVVVPGNSLSLGPLRDQGRFLETEVTIAFSNLSIDTLNLLAEQFRGLPLVLVKLNISISNGTLSGVLVLNALGN